MQSLKITLREGKHKGWDACHLERGPLTLILVPQVGGRIMGMLWRGHDLSFTQPEREGRVEDLSGTRDLRRAKHETGFPLWGGDKTWLAPQTRWTDGVPFLDLDSGPYDLSVEEEKPDVVRVRMRSQVCRETGIQITRTVFVFAESNEWIVTHRLMNRSPATVKWGIWDVSMVLRPGKVYLPRRETSPYPGGVKTFLEEGRSAEIRGTVLTELGSLAVIDCRESGKFKFGVDPVDGWMLGVIEVNGLGLVGFRKQVPVYLDRAYGHGCIAEVYNSDRYPYFEMEIHGPVIPLRPGESFELEERQVVFDLSRWPHSEDEVRQHLRLRS